MDKTTPATPASCEVAQAAFKMPKATEARLVSYALGIMKVRTMSDYPYSRTRLLLQAAHQVNTGT